MAQSPQDRQGLKSQANSLSQLKQTQRKRQSLKWFLVRFSVLEQLAWDFSPWRSRLAGKVLIALIFASLLLSACGDTPRQAVQSLPPTAASTREPTLAPLYTPITRLLPTVTPVLTVQPRPTFTPFVAPPTATLTPLPPTLVPTPTLAIPTPPPSPSGPNLDVFGKLPVSFQAAYQVALLDANTVDSKATLVLAQVNGFSATTATWVFYLVKKADGATPDKMWVVTYDAATRRTTVDPSRKPLLVNDVGQIAVTKVLDSSQIAAKLQSLGFPAQTPFDSAVLQVQDPGLGRPRVPAWLLTNGSLNRQLIINAYTGEIIKNGFSG